MKYQNALRATALCALMACGLTACIHAPIVPPMKGMVSSPSLDLAAPDAARSATLPFLFDDNRMFVVLEFIRPDGGVRKALAYVNMGQAAPILSDDLFRELEIDKGKPLDFRFGTMAIRVDAAATLTQDEAMSFTINLHSGKPDKPSFGGNDAAKHFFAPLPVEAVLPAGVLQNFEVVMDYDAKTLTLAAPGTIKPVGVAVPVRLNDETGLITAETVIAGKKREIVIDNGGSYTVLRASAVTAILDDHPDWQRGTGAVGEANTLMGGPDAVAPMLRASQMDMEALHLDDIGIVGSGMGSTMGWLLGGFFWDYYSDKAGVDVDGWFGGNVLKGFQLTIDYPNRTTYWLKQNNLDPHDLDQVGITLVRAADKYVVGGIALKGGKETVEGVQAGDTLVQVDQLKADGATRGQVLTALHGKPGEHRHLVLERDGKRIDVDATVTAF
jgi:hypothetical protein